MDIGSRHLSCDMRKHGASKGDGDPSRLAALAPQDNASRLAALAPQDDASRLAALAPQDDASRLAVIVIGRRADPLTCTSETSGKIVLHRDTMRKCVVPAQAGTHNPWHWWLW